MGDGGGERRARHDGFGDKKRAVFLEALSETCHVRHSAERAGICTSTAYKTYKNDAEFAGRWMEALSLGYVRLEERLLAHALRQVGDDGGDRPVIRESEGAGVAEGKSAFTDARLALALLNRHAGSVQGGRMSPVKGRREVTSEETDAVLRKLLDQVAKRRAKAADA